MESIDLDFKSFLFNKINNSEKFDDSILRLPLHLVEGQHEIHNLSKAPILTSGLLVELNLILLFANPDFFGLPLLRYVVLNERFDPVKLFELAGIRSRILTQLLILNFCFDLILHLLISNGQILLRLKILT